MGVASQIDEVILRGLAPVLREDGFRKSGRTFHRRVDAVVEVLDVQASQSNVGDVGRFTLNLGVYFRDVDELLGDAALDRPKEYQCHLRARIGALMGSGDHWWTLDSATSPADVVPEVERAYRDLAVSWFARYRLPLPACESLLRRDGPTETALALAIVGKDVERARTILRAIAEDVHTPRMRADRITEWASRFGVAREEGARRS